MSKKEFDGRAVSAATEGAGKAVALKAEAERLKGEKNKLTSYLMSVSAWQNYDLPLGFEGTKSAVVITGTLPVSADIGRLSGIASEELSAVQIEIVAEGKSTRYISAVCHNSVEKQLTALLSEAGFIKSNFPSQTGTAREEMAKIISQASKLYEYFFPGAVDMYTDSSSVSEWSVKFVSYVTQSGLMNGNTDGSFEPMSNATRAETAAVICRMIDWINNINMTGVNR